MPRLSPLVSLLELLAQQEPGGAFLAAPTFPPYRYCWLRDGSFIAYALDRAGQGAASRRFHLWAADVVLRRRDRIEALVEARAQGRPLDPRLFLHTRYSALGEEGTEPWGNFQLDGYGAWLWALERHVALSWAGGGSGGHARDGEALSAAASLVVRYLAALWDQPCFDPWEEYPDRRHVATLAAVYGGLEAARRAAPRLALSPEACRAAGEAARAAQGLVLTRGVSQGRLTKWLDDPDARPDASLLWASVPFGLVSPTDPVMAATAAEVEAELLGGGVRRYPGDGFYGGGEWPVLAAWLGWYWTRAGRRGGALRLLRWIEEQADEEGHLPEQVPGPATDPGLDRWWRQRWGPPARPLLWSHAMHLVLAMEVARPHAGSR
ncbi:MAG: hypothetical protein K6T75_07510 [Acetobacteraceae bacterium]|nr:hypothetical protein [Acetobacteraceae bacterium]